MLGGAKYVTNAFFSNIPIVHMTLFDEFKKSIAENIAFRIFHSIDFIFGA